MHEPGEQAVLGRSFPAGEEGGVAALAFLAAHPATLHSLATKLVRHFVTDDPAPADVRRVEAVLHDSNGDLGQAALAVTSLPGAWQPLAKLRTPQDYVLAALRAADLPPDNRPGRGGHHARPRPAHLRRPVPDRLAGPRVRLVRAGADDAPGGTGATGSAAGPPHSIRPPSPMPAWGRC